MRWTIASAAEDAQAARPRLTDTAQHRGRCDSHAADPQDGRAESAASARDAGVEQSHLASYAITNDRQMIAARAMPA